MTNLPMLFLTPEEMSKIEELLANPPKPSEYMKAAYGRYCQYVTDRPNFEDTSKHEISKDK